MHPNIVICPIKRLYEILKKQGAEGAVGIISTSEDEPDPTILWDLPHVYAIYRDIDYEGPDAFTDYHATHFAELIKNITPDGKGKGFGQSNVWYADSEYARENIIPEVTAYLEANKTWRINRISADFLAPANVSMPLTEKENAQADDYFDENEYMKFLPLGYRAYNSDPTADNAYFMAAAMKGLHQYEKAIEWFSKVIELEGDSWDSTSNLPYLYMECGQHVLSMEVATKLLDFPEANDPVVKHEIYGILANNNFGLGNYEEAVSWLDRIIAESDDADAVEPAKQTREDWLAIKNTN